jgi:hypothetical protein
LRVLLHCMLQSLTMWRFWWYWYCFFHFLPLKQTALLLGCPPLRESFAACCRSIDSKKKRTGCWAHKQRTSQSHCKRSQAPPFFLETRLICEQKLLKLITKSERHAKRTHTLTHHPAATRPPKTTPLSSTSRDTNKKVFTIHHQPICKCLSELSAFGYRIFPCEPANSTHN